tara:strand:+ start:6796 stop:7263 length:468 start_codon:yes stop_codon:yes gene_type:complete
MKIKLTESQYKKIVLREFGETVVDPKEWYLNILSWVDSPNDLTFKSSAHEVVVFDQDGVYLGYYDKEQNFGFVVNEYNIDTIDDDELIDEQEEGGTSDSAGGGSGSVWSVSPTRGPANTLDNSTWGISPTRGPANTLDNSPWSVEPSRGPANTLN